MSLDDEFRVERHNTKAVFSPFSKEGLRHQSYKVKNNCNRAIRLRWVPCLLFCPFGWEKKTKKQKSKPHLNPKPKPLLRHFSKTTFHQTRVLLTVDEEENLLFPPQSLQAVKL